MSEADTDWAAIVMAEKVDHWYYAEREICARATDAEPPCVRSVGHDGDCDGTYRPSWDARFTEWIDHQRAENRAEMAHDRIATSLRPVDSDPNRGRRRVPLTYFSAADLLGLHDEEPSDG